MANPNSLRAPGTPDRLPRAYAALDLGSNNCRLLVARPVDSGFEVIDSFSRIVRLGEGVASSGRLAERAMARTLAALRVCARIVARHRVAGLRCVATEACRRAANGAEFLARVERVTGLTFELLPTEAEAQLALIGCLPLLDPDAEHVLLVDIGGGSTELVWLERGAGGDVVRLVLSLPLGVVVLAESCGAEPDEAAFEAMVRRVQRLLVPIEVGHRLRERIGAGRVQMIGTSGTVTTLAAIHLGLPRYDRRRIDGLVLPTAALAAVSGELRAMTNRERAAHPCIGAGRADLVVAGCAILAAILRSWPVPTLVVADRGLREGLLHGLMGRAPEDLVVEAAGASSAASDVA
jgi:exopolyphosphatase/guanosine-5'-triphosphate,3'-diphosphate pyrophosphatase